MWFQFLRNENRFREIFAFLMNRINSAEIYLQFQIVEALPQISWNSDRTILLRRKINK